MIEPLISAAAYAAGARAVRGYEGFRDPLDVADDAIKAAAPLIVVAELQALVDALDQKYVDYRVVGQTPRASGVGTAIDLLRTRIDELSADE